MVFSKLNIDNFFDLNFQNTLSPSPLQQTNSLKRYIGHFWDSSRSILAVIGNRLYYTKSGTNGLTKSWNLDSADLIDHENLQEDDIMYDFAYCQVDGKIWRTGGYKLETGGSKDTFFLGSNFTWSQGPELPAAKESHTMLAINEDEVIIFGGNLQGYARKSGNAVWIYNDKHSNYSIMKDFELGSRPTAAKIHSDDIGKEVIIVLIKNAVFFYDWPFDSWIKADETWIHPVPQFERVKLFIANER